MAHKILTVDDSKVVRIMVTRALKPYDCVIVEAVNGAEGLEAAAREKPDLIILDVTMPVMTGLEMLTNLRLDPALKVIPVIMLTAESAQENIAKADSLGISGYVAKPFKEDQLVDKVKAAIPMVAKPAA
ncbi:MAG: response regulator [Verrucomicrobia bacterium]|jgi:CheY-like chemotaxis protein|nr:response regulator [Verrucomicrobiota bacterium]